MPRKRVLECGSVECSDGNVPEVEVDSPAVYETKFLVAHLPQQEQDFELVGFRRNERWLYPLRDHVTQ